jgi:Holliday junction resolvase RusA-like endonuclease
MVGNGPSQSGQRSNEIIMLQGPVFYLLNLPMPPSVNALFAGTSRRYKSDKYKAFEWEISRWALKNGSSLQLLRAEIEKAIFLDREIALSMSYEFYFTYESILTKENKPKRNDTANRIKAIEDSIAKLIGVDDKYFWSGTFNKRVGTHNQCNVSISLVDYTGQAIGYPFNDSNT